MSPLHSDKALISLTRFLFLPIDCPLYILFFDLPFQLYKQSVFEITQASFLQISLSKFRCLSTLCRCCFFNTCRMTPLKKLMMAIIHKAVITISVGYLATIPVFKVVYQNRSKKGPLMISKETNEIIEKNK